MNIPNIHVTSIYRIHRQYDTCLNSLLNLSRCIYYPPLSKRDLFRTRKLLLRFAFVRISFDSAKASQRKQLTSLAGTPSSSKRDDIWHYNIALSFPLAYRESTLDRISLVSLLVLFLAFHRLFSFVLIEEAVIGGNLDDLLVENHFGAPSIPSASSYSGRKLRKEGKGRGAAMASGKKINFQAAPLLAPIATGTRIAMEKVELGIDLIRRAMRRIFRKYIYAFFLSE